VIDHGYARQLLIPEQPQERLDVVSAWTAATSWFMISATVAMP